jgi:bifunctional isochorismate lyase / aryl carrier protein
MSTSLPTIAPYAMPRSDELPAGRASWTVDPGRAVLLVHDMQRYFLAPFDHDAEPVSLLIAHLGALLRRARERGVPVLYTAQPGEQPPADRALLAEFWGAGPAAAFRDDPDVVGILDAVAPHPGDEVLTKWRYSAFQRSPLAERLAGWGRDQLLVTGIYAHIGCMVTAVDAFMRDVQPFLVADAVADFSRDHHDRALEWTASRCGVVTTTADVLAAFGSAFAGTERERPAPERVAASLARGEPSCG